jgi:hypothetical protein
MTGLTRHRAERWDATAFMQARTIAFDALLETADLDRLATDREYEAELQAEAERMAAERMEEAG